LVLSATFSGSEKFPGKGLTDEFPKFLLNLFPLKRKLFEIYFVRLIGTPNQNSKSGINRKVGVQS
jgi:hypothetical protein